MKRSCRSKRCNLLDFYKFRNHFWQHVYPKVRYYLDLSFLDKFQFYKGLLLHWLIPRTYILNKLALHVWIAYMNDGCSKVPSVLRSSWAIPNCWSFSFRRSCSGSTLAWLTQRLVFSGMEKRFDFKVLTSAHCFTKFITSKIRINTPVTSFCKSNVVAWQKYQSYEILQFFQCYFELWFILVSIGILIGLIKK